jgi:NAD(P)-dependent dehydrogenase (short-subunit alcohol dehydrogenase family)
MADGAPHRVVVIGASSGLGRCIGIGIGQRGSRVALLARRKDRLERAASEAGAGTLAIECDVTSEASVRSAVEEAAAGLGGIDALVYTPALGHLARIEDTDFDTWQNVFATNVTGASIATAAALPHLRASKGVAIYLSSVTGSETPPWGGLGSYAVSKAAMEKLIEAWRGEHPDIGFTRVIVGECAGGEGESLTGFADRWDGALLGDLVGTWVTRGYMTGALMDVQELVNVVDSISRTDASVCIRSVTVTPRLIVPDVMPSHPEHGRLTP